MRGRLRSSDFGGNLASFPRAPSAFLVNMRSGQSFLAAALSCNPPRSLASSGTGACIPSLPRTHSWLGRAQTRPQEPPTGPRPGALQEDGGWRPLALTFPSPASPPREQVYQRPHEAGTSQPPRGYLCRDLTCCCPRAARNCSVRPPAPAPGPSPLPLGAGGVTCREEQGLGLAGGCHAQRLLTPTHRGVILHRHPPPPDIHTLVSSPAVGQREPEGTGEQSLCRLFAPGEVCPPSGSLQMLPRVSEAFPGPRTRSGVCLAS